VNEEDLIRVLVRDNGAAVRMLRVERQLGLFLLCAAAVVVVFTKAGMAVSGDVALLPVLVCLVILCAGAMGAILSSIPGRASWRVSATVVIAALIVWVADITLRAMSAWRVGGEVWGNASWLKCLGFTTGVSLLAVFVLFRVIRRGWPVRPRLTAALTFVSGASAAALTTTLECPSNAPLHVLFGHIIPVLVVTVLGAAVTASLFAPSASHHLNR